MVLLFAATLTLIALGAFCLQVFARVRHLDAVAGSQVPMPSADRYRPMLRLLSSDDQAFASADKALVKKFRARRVHLFREYLRCLTKDYGRLLAGIRRVMLASAVDRPDLARVLVVNKLWFGFALCRIEIRLFLHQAGIGTVDVSGLVEAMDALRTQFSFLAVSPAALAAH